LDRRGVPTLYGDAANSEVLRHAGLSRASALVITIPDEAACQIIVAAGRDQASELPIITRSATEEGARQLSQLGAQQVIRPELEGGLEIVRHTLLQLQFPLQEIYRYTDTVRQQHYDTQINTEEEHRLLHNLLEASERIEIFWILLAPGNPLLGQTLAGAELRARTGASVVAILRENRLIANPKSNTIFEVADRIGVIGEKEQIQAVELLLADRVESE
jgi:CPA2 family monovalent cation:H+ antiporter-2